MIYSTHLVLRSLLFVPGHIDRFFESALKSDADAIVIDLEDSVPEMSKDDARLLVTTRLDAIPAGRPVFVRINGKTTGRMKLDVRACIHNRLTGLIVPKVSSAEDILSIDRYLSELEAEAELLIGRVKMFPLIETCGAVLQALDIVKASKRNLGLVFGHEDFLLDLQGTHTTDDLNLLMPRMMVVMAARTIGGHPIDTPYLNIKDMAGFREKVLTSRALGFSGTLILHPTQIETANTGYAPSTEEICEARKIIAQVEASMKESRSIAYSDGRFTAPPILKQAKQTLELHNKIKSICGGAQ